MFGGIVLAIYGFSHNSTPEGVAGVVVGSAGLASSIIGSSLSTPVLPLDEALRYSKHYDGLLRGHLGLSKQSQNEGPAAAWRFALAPTVEPRSVGLWGTLSF
jgi:hypothetical protein